MASGSALALTVGSIIANATATPQAVRIVVTSSPSLPPPPSDDNQLGLGTHPYASSVIASASVALLHLFISHRFEPHATPLDVSLPCVALAAGLGLGLAFAAIVILGAAFLLNRGGSTSDQQSMITYQKEGGSSIRPGTKRSTLSKRASLEQEGEKRCSAMVGVASEKGIATHA